MQCLSGKGLREKTLTLVTLEITLFAIKTKVKGFKAKNKGNHAQTVLQLAK